MLTQARRMMSLLLLLALAGCATLPSGPSVRVLPAPGKPFDTFMAEDATCRQWAEHGIGMNAQETANQNTATGAVVGTVVGTGIGAALGAASGNAGAGAAIGAGSGLLFGTASGASAGEEYGWQAQRRYDNAYVQCMYAKGNQIPGMVKRPRRMRSLPPPPPSSESYRPSPGAYPPSPGAYPPSPGAYPPSPGSYPPVPPDYYPPPR